MPPADISRYRQNHVTTASPGEVLLALYDGAIRLAKTARKAIDENQPAAKGEALGRVIAIINELNSTLDHQQAPELCANLELLYNYMVERINEASTHMVVDPLDEVIRHLERLRETWAEAVGNVTRESNERDHG